MKNNDIILDFTSLLDVILIILFFFILFSKLDTNSENQKIKTEALQKMEQAESKLEEAENIKSKADELLEELAKSDERTANNIDAITSFSRNENFKMKLVFGESSWKLMIYNNNNLIEDLSYIDDESFEKSLDNTFKSHFEPNDTILCELLYDASEPGSHRAYESVVKAFDVIKNEYTYLYYSETDLSIFEESDDK